MSTLAVGGVGVSGLGSAFGGSDLTVSLRWFAGLVTLRTGWRFGASSTAGAIGSASIGVITRGGGAGVSSAGGCSGSALACSLAHPQALRNAPASPPATRRIRTFAIIARNADRGTPQIRFLKTVPQPIRPLEPVTKV